MDYDYKLGLRFAEALRGLLDRKRIEVSFSGHKAIVWLNGLDEARVIVEALEAAAFRKAAAWKYPPDEEGRA